MEEHSDSVNERIQDMKHIVQTSDAKCWAFSCLYACQTNDRFQEDSIACGVGSMDGVRVVVMPRTSNT